MTLMSWIENRETDNFTVSDTDGHVIYDSHETEYCPPYDVEMMLVVEVERESSNCPEVVVADDSWIEYNLSLSRDAVGRYMELARRYGMKEYGDVLAETVANMHALYKILHGED